MRNIEKLRDYFLGKDPQLKETMADNSLRLIGIEGKYFVLRTELLARLKKLKDELTEVDEDLQRQIDGVIDDLEGVDGRVTALETWKDNTDFVLADDLALALAGYYTKTQTDGLLNDKQDVLTAGENITINNNVISANGGLPKFNLAYNDATTLFNDYVGQVIQIESYKNHLNQTVTTYNDLYYVVDAYTLKSLRNHLYNEQSGTPNSCEVAYYQIEWSPVAQMWVVGDVNLVIKSTSINNLSTNNQLATAKAVYDFASQAGGIPEFELRFDDPATKFEDYVGKAIQITSFTQQNNVETAAYNGLYDVSTATSLKSLSTFKSADGRPAHYTFSYDAIDTAWLQGTQYEMSGTTIISTASTDSQYPTAKAVYDFATQAGGFPKFNLSENDASTLFDNYVGKLVEITHYTGGMYPNGTDLYNDIYYVGYAPNSQLITLYGLRNYTIAGTSNTEVICNHSIYYSSAKWGVADHYLDNISTSISSSSTNKKKATEKAVYDFVKALADANGLTMP